MSINNDLLKYWHEFPTQDEILLLKKLQKIITKKGPQDLNRSPFDKKK